MKLPITTQVNELTATAPSPKGGYRIFFPVELGGRRDAVTRESKLGGIFRKAKIRFAWRATLAQHRTGREEEQKSDERGGERFQTASLIGLRFRFSTDKEEKC